MAKRPTKKPRDTPKSSKVARVETGDVSTIIQTNYLKYGSHTIENRALPDFRDGLSPVQRRALFAMFEERLTPDKNYRKASFIIGKCFAAGTKVTTPRGFENIEDLAVGDEVATRYGTKPVTATMSRKVSETLTIRTKSGRELVLSKDHRLLSLTKKGLRWTKASALTSSDCLVSSGVYNQIQKINTVATDWCYLAGVWAGNGSVDWSNGNTQSRVSVCTPNSACRDRILLACRRLGLNVGKMLFAPSPITSGVGLYTIRLTAEASRRFVSKFGLVHNKTKSSAKILPEFVFKSGRSMQSALAGLFDTDGCLTENYVRRKSQAVYSSCSSNLLNQIKLLLSVHGITGVVYKANVAGNVHPGILGKEIIANHDCWNLVIGGHGLWQLLNDNKVPLSNSDRTSGWGSKDLDVAKNSSVLSPELPGLTRRLVELVKTNKLGLGPTNQGRYKRVHSQDEVRISLRYGNGQILRPENTAITLHHLRSTNIVDFLFRIGDYAWAEAALTLSQEHVSIDRVVSKKRTAGQKVYDIEVAEVHEFMANGVVSHNCMSSYHPHGDASIYGALVGLAHTNMRMVDGMGNWGRPELGASVPAAAPRYIECRMSPATQALLFDKRLMAVTDFVPNFDGSTKEPVVLPALLPLALINGAQGIAVGTTTAIPSFTAESVLAATLAALYERSTEAAKLLKLASPYGGLLLSTKADLSSLFDSSQGKSSWTCAFETDLKAKSLTITGLAPQWPFDAASERIRQLPDVKAVRDLSSGNDVRLEVLFRSSVTKDSFPKAVTSVEKLLKKSLSYRLNFTERTYVPASEKDVEDVSASFFSASLTTVLDKWVAWRLNLEVKAANHEASVLQAKIARESLLARAASELEALVKILRTKGKTQDQKRAMIGKLLECSEDEAKFILTIPLGRFDRLNEDDSKATIAKLKQELKAAEADAKAPSASAARRLEALGGVVAAASREKTTPKAKTARRRKG
jgi:DNA gyrase subunit A